jgi:two-component system response regulator PilR (NtrC family)
LREHPEDIPALARHLLERRFRHREGGGPPPSLSSGALERLQGHPLKGNVRELENLLERALSLTEGPVIPADAVREPRDRNPAGVDPPAPEAFDLDAYLAEAERAQIETTLERTGGNKSEAARRLGITLRSLRYRIQKLGLE